MGSWMEMVRLAIPSREVALGGRRHRRGVISKTPFSKQNNETDLLDKMKKSISIGIKAYRKRV
ncbi:hypothetical protein [Halobacillus campisalis]|uniref:hypothetical protein n=1 Tax=Halobacillus campisalis TaxID=435909 RepID=UPI0036F1BD3E